MEPQPNLEPKQQSRLPIIISIILLIFFLSSTVFLYYQNTKLQERINYLTQTDTPSVLPTPEEEGPPLEDPTAAWQTSSSSHFAYSFRYPPEWELHTFNENDPLVKFGSNSLSNYSGTTINQFTNHGIIDWSKFIGSKAAIKIDYAIYSKQAGPNHFKDKNTFLKQIISENSQKLTQTDLIIGTLPTEQYKATDNLGPTDVPEINTFVAYPDDDRIVYLTLMFWNVPSYSDLKTTSEWQQLSQILSTFKFTNPIAVTMPSSMEGYIREVKRSNGQTTLTLDPAEWVTVPNAPNGYEIRNQTKDTVILNLNSASKIIMQTYSHDASGNFNFNQPITTDQFLGYIQSLTEQNPFFIIEIDPSTQNVIKITEKYQP